MKIKQSEAFISLPNELQKRAVGLRIEWTTLAFKILAIFMWHPSSVFLRAFRKRKREGWEPNLLKSLRWIKNQVVILVVLMSSSRTDLVYLHLL
jgi:hypothetical protein